MKIKMYMFKNKTERILIVFVFDIVSRKHWRHQSDNQKPQIETKRYQ